MRSLVAGAIVLAAMLVVAPARADEKDVEAYLQAFYESALWNDGRWPVSTVKWTRPVRVRLSGPMSDTYAEMVLSRLREMTVLAGLELVVLKPGEKDENFLVEFTETHQLFAGGRAAGCVSYWRTAGDTGLVNVRLVINLAQQFGLRRCITHEGMHAMGFPGHPHAIDSILSYTHNREDLTAIDKMSLRVLYDPRVKPAQYQLPAMALARTIIVEKLMADGVPNVTPDMGERFVKNLVPLTIKLAEDGNVGLQYQLGVAYTFGQVVDKDEKAGFAWFQRAAQATQPEWRGYATDAMSMIGYGLASGRGVAADPVSAIRWYKEAAARGQVVAQNNLAFAYENGKGTDVDKVEAYKWYTLAANKKYKLAETNLAKLITKMTADEVEQGRRRADAWRAPAN